MRQSPRLRENLLIAVKCAKHALDMIRFSGVCDLQANRRVADRQQLEAEPEAEDLSKRHC